MFLHTSLLSKLFVILFIVGILTSMAILPSEALTGYSYTSNILISNSTGTAYTSRIKFQVPALNLVTGNYIQSDGEDARITDSSGVEESSLVKNLTSNTAYWTTDIISIPAHGDVNRTLWTGNTTATKDQSWIGSDGDTNTIADAADLDITTNLTLKTDIYVPSLPATEKKILSKPGAYELAVDNTNFLFRVYKSSGPTTVTLLPNGIGSISDQTPNPGVDHYLNVDDPVGVPDDITTYCAAVGVSAADSYNIENGAIPLYSNITSVTVYFRVYTNIVAASQTARSSIKLGANSLYGAVIAAPGAWTTYNQTFTRPGGGSWVSSDIANVEIGTVLGATGGASTYCTQVYLSVTYEAPDAGYTTQIAATAGSWKTITGTYDGANQILTDGTLSDNDALAGAINTNGESISVAIATAKFDSLKIGDTNIAAPTWKANFEFEPDEISATTINDLSAGGLNDITYSLGANPAGITVTLGSLTSTDETTTIEGEALIEAGALGELNSPGNTTGDPENVGPGTDFDTFVNVIPNTTDTPAYMVWVWLYVFCMLITVAITLRYSGGHFFIGGVAALFITGAFVAMGSGNGNSIIPWWFLLLDGIGIVGLLAMEKNSVP
ncbi:MAG: hypothetical protein WC554_07150 [Clostridia bacterium]